MRAVFETQLVENDTEERVSCKFPEARERVPTRRHEIYNQPPASAYRQKMQQERRDRRTYKTKYSATWPINTLIFLFLFGSYVFYNNINIAKVKVDQNFL